MYMDHFATRFACNNNNIYFNQAVAVSVTNLKYRVDNNKFDKNIVKQ